MCAVPLGTFLAPEGGKGDTLLDQRGLPAKLVWGKMAAACQRPLWKVVLE